MTSIGCLLRIWRPNPRSSIQIGKSLSVSHTPDQRKRNVGREEKGIIGSAARMDVLDAAAAAVI